MTERSGFLQTNKYDALTDRELLTNAPLSSAKMSSNNGTAIKGGIVPGFDRVSSLAVTQRGAGANMSIDVSSGQAVVPAVNGGRSYYLYTNDATKNIVIAASHLTLARIDAVYIRIDDADYGETANQGQTVVITGTPNTNPSEPPAPPVGTYYKLATVRVNPSVTSIVNGNITQTAKDWVTPTGGTVYTNNSNAFSGATQIPLGTIEQALPASEGGNAAADGVYFSTSATNANKRNMMVGHDFSNDWNAWQPTINEVSVYGTGAVLEGYWKYFAGATFVFFFASITFGTSPGVGSDSDWEFTIPFPYTPPAQTGYWVWTDVSGYAWDNSANQGVDLRGVVWKGRETTNMRLSYQATASSGIAAQIGFQRPFPWAVNDRIEFCGILPIFPGGTYETFT